MEDRGSTAVLAISGLVERILSSTSEHNSRDLAQRRRDHVGKGTVATRSPCDAASGSGTCIWGSRTSAVRRQLLQRSHERCRGPVHRNKDGTAVYVAIVVRAARTAV